MSITKTSLVDRYRPESFDSVIGQEHVISVLKEIIAKKEKPPHMLFIGPAGTGKTTVAICLAKALHGTSWRTYFHEFNASDNRKIDFIRSDIKPLSQSVVEQEIFFDEADGITFDSQQALRRIIEQSPNTTFILTANTETKLIEPLRSRCVIFRFKALTEDQIKTKLFDIFQKEKVDVKFNEEEREALIQIIKESHGDLRKAINILEKIITSNKELNVKSVLEMSSVDLVTDAVNTAIKGNFEGAKNLIEDAYIVSGNSVDRVIDDLYFAVDKVEDNDVKIRLYHELGVLDHQVRTSTKPIIQLVAWISFAWICPRLKK